MEEREFHRSSTREEAQAYFDALIKELQTEPIQAISSFCSVYTMLFLVLDKEGQRVFLRAINAINKMHGVKFEDMQDGMEYLNNILQEEKEGK